MADGPASSDEIARSALWRALEVSGSELLSFGIMVLLARLLLPEDYGVVAIASVLVMIAQMVVYHGFAEAIIQHRPPSEEQDSSVLWANIGIGAVLMLILASIAYPLATLLQKPLLGDLLLALSPIMLFFGVTGIVQARVRRELRIKVLAIRTLVAVIAGGGLGIALAALGWGAWALVGQQLAHAIAGTIILCVMSGWRPQLAIDWPSVKALLRFGWQAMTTFLLDIVSRNISTLILGYFLIAELVGQFFVANRVFFSLAMLTFMSISELCLPLLARLQSEPDRYVLAVYRSFRMTSLICLPAFLGAAVVSIPLVEALFGTQWQPAAAPLAVLATFGALHSVTALITHLLLSLNRPEKSLTINLVATCLLVFAVTLAAPFGLVAAALAIGAVQLVLLPFAWRILRLELALDGWRVVREQLPIWAATAAMLLGVAAADWVIAYWPSGLRLLALVTFGGTIYLGVLRLAAAELFEETLASLRDALAKKPAMAP